MHAFIELVEDTNDQIFEIDWGFCEWLKFQNPQIQEKGLKILLNYIEKLGNKFSINNSKNKIYDLDQILDLVFSKILVQKNYKIKENAYKFLLVNMKKYPKESFFSMG